MAAGLDSCPSHLESFAFADDELGWLWSHEFDQDTIDASSQLRITGDAWAVSDRRVAPRSAAHDR
jgi:nicotinic acid phosphoribosyltransferase